MRRLGYIFAAVLLLGGVVRADQGWQDNQDGNNFACYDVGSFSANNLTTGGRTYSTPLTGEIVNSNPAWWTQATWYVDPLSVVATCNDANTGLTSGVPLCTMAEVARRTDGATYPLAGVGCVVYLESSKPATDFANFHYTVDAPATSTLNPGGFDVPFMIIGVPTDLGFSGVASSVQNGALGSTSDIHFTDSGIPTSFTASGFLATNVVLHKTSGTPGYFWPALDLGSKTLRASQINTGFATYTTFTNGDTYRVQSLPNFNSATFPVVDAEFPAAAIFGVTVSDASGSNPAATNPGIMWFESSFQNLQQHAGWYINDQFIDQQFFAAATYGNRFGGFIYSGLGRATGAATQWVFKFGSTWQLSDEAAGFTTLEKIKYTVDVSGDGERIQAQFFDSPNSLISLGQGSFANVEAMGGAGNTSNIVNLQNTTSRVTYATAPSAGMTSDTTPIQVLTANYAVSALPVSDVNSGTYVVAETSTPVTSAGCAQFNTSGQLTSTGTSCASGGGVTSVTGTAQRISATPTTGAVVVDTIGGYYSGATSGGNQDLGLLTSGELLLTQPGGTMSTVTPYQCLVSAADTVPGYLAGKISAALPVVVTDSAGASPVLSGLKAWLRGSTLTTGTISTWADSSGNGNDYVQATGGKQPTVNPSSIFGNPGATFNGSTGLHSAFTLAAGAKTVVIVFVKTGSPASSAFYSAATVTTGSLMTDLDFMNIGGYQPYSFAGDYTSTTLAGVATALDAAPHILFLTYNGGSSSSTGSYTFTLDGSAKTVVASAAGGRASTDLSSIGARVDASNNIADGLVGDIDEVLIYDHVLSAPDQATDQAYLNAVYVTGANHSLVVSESYSCATSTWAHSSTTAGLVCTQPSFADLSGTAACGQITLGAGLACSTGTYDQSIPSSATTTYGGTTKVITTLGVDNYGRATNATSISALTCSAGASIAEITETSGPTCLTIGAIPDTAPFADVLIRPAGTSTIVGVSTAVLYSGKAPAALSYDFFGVSAGSGWLVTGNDTSVKTFGGSAVEYPLGQAFSTSRLRVINGLNSGTGFTALVLTVTRNGSATGATVSIPASSATVAFDSGAVAVSSGAATDTWGVELTYTGATVPAGVTDFTATASFQ